MICKYILPLLLLGLLSGCAAMFDNTRFYDGSIPESPQRWPDKVETCGESKSALVPLNIMVTATMFSRLPGYAGGCGAYPYGHILIEIKNGDFTSTDKHGVDSTSQARRFDVYYKWMLGADSDFKPDLHYDPSWTRHIPGTHDYPDLWQYNRPLPVDNKTVVINGLQWDHYMFYRFYSHNADPSQPAISVAPGKPLMSYGLYPMPVINSPHPNALTSIGEVYVHKVDANHKMMVWAQYDRTVTQNAHWLKVRRAMLRQLVEAITIKPLTPELLRKLQAEKQAQGQCLDNGGGSECTRIGRWSGQISSN